MELPGKYEMTNPEYNKARHKFEIALGNLLRVGVLIAGAVILIGGVLYIWRHGRELPEYAHFRGEPPDLQTVHGIFKDILSFNARAIIQLGFLLLIATPIVRVAFSVYGFAIQKDKIYVIITILVLGILIFSLGGGHF